MGRRRDIGKMEIYSKACGGMSLGVYARARNVLNMQFARFPHSICN